MTFLPLAEPDFWVYLLLSIEIDFYLNISLIMKKENNTDVIPAALDLIAYQNIYEY